MIKNNKKSILLVIILLFSFVSGGCSWPNEDSNIVSDLEDSTNQMMNKARSGINNMIESVAYLGRTDSDLASTKGQGLITRTTAGEDATVVSREYDERVFDIDTRGKYMIDSHGAVESITYPFTDVGRQEIYAKIKNALGEPVSQEGNGTSSPYKAVWKVNDVEYVLTDMYNDITLKMSRIIE